MKKSMTVILSLIGLVTLVACSQDRYKAVMNVESNIYNSWSMNYKYLDGVKTKTMTVKDGQIATFKVDIVSEEGELDFRITSADGTEAYVGIDLPTSTFEVFVDKSGKYELTVEAQDHKGSVKIELVTEEGKYD